LRYIFVNILCIEGWRFRFEKTGIIKAVCFKAEKTTHALARAGGLFHPG